MQSWKKALFWLKIEKNKNKTVTCKIFFCSCIQSAFRYQEYEKYNVILNYCRGFRGL
jgi:Pyruvate/2-oxoacid:ferredoxin oxidoreductase delta subunit